ncbi:DUF742 domain-containing protein [Streptantibioticus ferralitis]|uniref:DUF742 domain-containing protein n=1 Tax=Streptantibioticus ferralitis TaxID=236510 RepID=A0ABT5YSC5_9ACTN|nr:DUF742 domain-containing protein [Streptantibioticus ferralitis]MDF2254405.1 DUF742 domain-containing protein [Streptantibioticus ferralitis]
MTGGRHSRRLVPAYLATGGRAHPSRNHLDRLTTLHAACEEIPVGLGPEQRGVLELIQPGALPLVDAAAYLRLPVSIVKVLVADLVSAGLLHARPPIPQATGPDIETMEKVLDGLRALKS